VARLKVYAGWIGIRRLILVASELNTRLGRAEPPSVLVVVPPDLKNPIPCGGSMWPMRAKIVNRREEETIVLT
jgi:hypothetical protein